MKLWSIQVLRFVAAMLVVFNHAANDGFRLTGHAVMGGWPALASGRLGVEIFFVISGYIIAATSTGLTAPAFIARRARRILPLWATAGLLAMAWVSLTGALTWRGALATWLFWPATDVLTGPFIPVGWTLCFEVLFYAAFAAAIWRPKLAWILIFAPVAAYLARHIDPVFQFLGNPLIALFIAGVGLAKAPRWPPLAALLPLGIGLFLVQLVGEARGAAPVCLQPDLLAGTLPCLQTAGFGIPAFLIVAGVLQLETRKSVFTYLGDASYALYLTHYTVVAVASALMFNIFHLPVVPLFVVACTSAVLVSCGAYEWVEKPIMAWWRRSAAPKAAFAP